VLPKHNSKKTFDEDLEKILKPSQKNQQETWLTSLKSILPF
jgi:hypothetical protein